MTRIAPILAIIVASGCIETGLSKDEEPAEGVEPDILCDPPAIAFGAIAVGSSDVQEFTVSNVGDGVLEVDDILIASGESVFSVLGPDFEFDLAPGETKTVEVEFTPGTSEEIFGAVQVLSNDPDGDNSTVDLLGEGLVPDILVDPGNLEFPGVADGDTMVQTFTVSNVGNAPLDVSDVVLSAGNAFEVVGPEFQFTLDPGDSTTVDVAFAPLVADEDIGLVEVLSNDPDGDNSTVDLLGYGLLPDLEITPESYAFGDYFVPCGESVELTLTNVGDEDLEVTDASYTSGGHLLYDDSQLTFPFTLGPSESTSVWVDFLPYDAVADSGTLEVTSNDPDGVETATQEGNGLWTARQTETFTTPGAPPVDVLITIDQSCSMEDANQDDVEAGFPAFVQELQNVSDWRLLMVTDAFSQCTTTGVLDSSTPNIDNILTNNAFPAGHDDNGGANLTEKLLEMSYLALTKTGAGNCNEDFLRPGALLHIITISDEPEQSNQTAQHWVNEFENYVTDPALLKVSAVVDLSGCELGASGYTEAVSLTGGSSLDICDSSWGQNFTDIATEVLAGIQTYTLANPAEESTLEVEVNGVPTYDFTYDPVNEAVTVNYPYIGEKDTVDISYSIPATCN